MNIQKNTNTLCQLIQSFPIKKEVEQLFNNLYGFETIASQINRQFLGYLVANDQVKHKIQYSFIPGNNKLSSEELNVLEQVHQLLLYITNKICILDDLFPNAQLSINPYSDYNYILSKSHLVNFEKELISINDSLNLLSSSFKNHPSVSIINNYFENFTGFESINTEELLKYVLNYRKAIINHSFTDMSYDLELELFNQQDFKTYYNGRLIRSLIVLRDSIFNVNQFLYQALRYKKPVILNRDNVFMNQGLSQNWLGEVIYLRVQPIDKEMYSRPGDVVRVSLKLEHSPKDGFYRVEKIDISESSDFGLSLTFALRKIDENMICYPQLLI